MGTPSVKPRRFRDAIRRPRWIVAIVSIAAVVVVTLLATVPVPHSSSFSFRGGNFGLPPPYLDARFSQSLCPAGAKVAVAFSSTGLNVTFSILAPNYTWYWSQQSAFANVSFVVPTCGTYLIFVVGRGDGSYSIDGTLSYSAPLL